MDKINIKIVPKSACRPKPQPHRLLGVIGVILAVMILGQLPLFQSQPSWAAAKGFGIKSKDTPTQESVTPPVTQNTIEEQCKDLEPLYPCDNVVPPSLKTRCVQCYLDNVRDKPFLDTMKETVEYWNSFYQTIGGFFSGSGSEQTNLPGGEDTGYSGAPDQSPPSDQQLIEPPANNSLEQWRAFVAYYANLIWEKWARKVAYQKACRQATQQRNQCLEQEFDKRWQASVQPMQAACEAQVRNAGCHIVRRDGKDIEDCSGLDQKALAACKNLPPKGRLCQVPVKLPGTLSPGLPDDFLSQCTPKRYWLAENGGGCCPIAKGIAPKKSPIICPC